MTPLLTLRNLRVSFGAAQVVRGLIQRTAIDPALLDDVILGCAYPDPSQGPGTSDQAGARTRGPDGSRHRCRGD